jgi:hypothetical protein
MGMYNCPDCKKDGTHKKHDELESRISSMRYHSEDYDKTKGKGRFKKDHPDSVKMLDGMLGEKTKLLMTHMGHGIPVETPLEDKPAVTTVGSYSG